MHYKGKPLAGYDAVIPRIGASITRYGVAVLHQFELMGCRTLNPSQAIASARDKLRAHQLLAAQGIGMPATVFGDNPDDTSDLLSMLGPPPHVIKLNESAQGAGVMLTEKPSGLGCSVVEALRGLYANFLVQEFIAEAEGADVLFRRRRRGGGRDAPAGAERRFRSNLHRGGTAEAVAPSDDERAIRVRAAQVLGLGVAGVGPDPRPARAAGAGGQFLARVGRHRSGHRGRCPGNIIDYAAKVA